MKLNVGAFGLTCGILWGLGLFFMTWWILAFEHGSGAARSVFLSSVYRGYTISPAGSIIGLIWAFFDGWIGGLIFAWLYNLLSGGYRRPPQKPQ